MNIKYNKKQIYIASLTVVIIFSLPQAVRLLLL